MDFFLPLLYASIAVERGLHVRYTHSIPDGTDTIILHSDVGLVVPLCVMC